MRSPRVHSGRTQTPNSGPRLLPQWQLQVLEGYMRWATTLAGRVGRRAEQAASPQNARAALGGL